MLAHWSVELSVPEHIKCTTHIGSLEYYSIYEMHYTQQFMNKTFSMLAHWSIELNIYVLQNT